MATPYRFAAVSLVFIPILDRTVLKFEFFKLSLGPPAPIVEKGVMATDWRSPIASPYNLPLGPKSLCEVGEFYRSRARFDARIHRLDVVFDFSAARRPPELILGSMGSEHAICWS